jgi:hypothetical protein
MPKAMIATSEKSAGFFRSGWQELRRQFARRKLRRQAQQLELKRATALRQVGQQAWQSEIDLSPYPVLREQLAGLGGRASELSATAKKLAEEKAALEARRQSETARFDNQRRRVEEAKRPVDAALQAARNQLREQEQTAKRLQARRSALPGEMAACERLRVSAEAGSAPDKSAQMDAARKQKQQLELETQNIAVPLAQVQQRLPSLSADVQRLNHESQQYAAEIQKIEGERNSVVSPIVADLARVQRDRSAAGQESAAVDQEQHERFLQLGQALYESNAADSAIASGIGQVEAINRDRADNQAGTEGSLAQTRAMRPRTMLKFWGTLGLGAGIVVAAGVVAYSYLAPSPPIIGTALGWVQKDEDRKDAILKSYIQSSRDASKRDASYARLRRDAIRILQDDMRRLAETGDEKYLPQLAKSLRSDEPELRTAAADTIGRIGPTSAEIPALSGALNDPVQAVRSASLHALEVAPKQGSVPLLIGRALDEFRPVSAAKGLQPEEPPDAHLLGVPVNPNSTFLYFASNAAEGRAAYKTLDSLKQVVSFYQPKGQRGPLTSGEFGREYLGPLVLDRAAAQRLIDQAQAALSGPAAAPTPSADLPAVSAETQMLQYLVLRYSEEKFYGSPAYIVIEERSSGDTKKPTRFVVVFEDRASNTTGFVIHFPSSER